MLSMQKGMATKQEQLLYEKWPLIKPLQSTEECHLYGTYVSDVIGDLYQIARTCL